MHAWEKRPRVHTSGETCVLEKRPIKETCVLEKRPVYWERDLCVVKETYTRDLLTVSHDESQWVSVIGLFSKG